MKRVVIIHQDSIRSYSVDRLQHREDEVGRKPKPLKLGASDHLVPMLQETRRSLARYSQRKETLGNNPVFTLACERAGIKVTPRQARKWNNHRGAAYKLFQKERRGHK